MQDSNVKRAQRNYERTDHSYSMPESILQFLIALNRRLGPLPDVPGLRDPLAALAEIVNASPATPEAKTLRKVAESIWSDTGTVTETEIFSLDRRSLALVTALAEDRIESRYSEHEWQAALHRLRV